MKTSAAQAVTHAIPDAQPNVTDKSVSPSLSTVADSPRTDAAPARTIKPAITREEAIRLAMARTG